MFSYCVYWNWCFRDWRSLISSLRSLSFPLGFCVTKSTVLLCLVMSCVWEVPHWVKKETIQADRAPTSQGKFAARRNPVLLRFLLGVTCLTIGTSGTAASECYCPVPKRRFRSRYKSPSFAFSSNTLISRESGVLPRGRSVLWRGHVSPQGFF